MRTIPLALYNKEIKSFIDHIITYETANDFYSLDEIYQDEFVALCIRALDCDVDIVLGSKGNNALVNFLLSYERDKEIDVMKAIKESAREQFGIYFDEIFNEEKHRRIYDSIRESELNRREIRWY